MNNPIKTRISTSLALLATASMLSAGSVSAQTLPRPDSPVVVNPEDIRNFPPEPGAIEPIVAWPAAVGAVAAAVAAGAAVVAAPRRSHTV
jgi:hypothetical protein